MNLKDCVVYDVEIAKTVKSVKGGWDNPGGMGFGSAVAYDYFLDQYRFFLHDPAELLELLSGRIAVTFNGVKFDSRVLLGNDRLTKSVGGGRVQIRENATSPPQPGGIYFNSSWEDLDLLLLYVRARFEFADVAEAEEKLGDKSIHDGSFGLDGLAKGTLGLKKTGHGAKAPLLYQAQKYAELLEHNCNDVRLTKMLFDFVRKHGFMVDEANRVVRIELGDLRCMKSRRD
jgi:hypothetical protein